MTTSKRKEVRDGGGRRRGEERRRRKFNKKPVRRAFHRRKNMLSQKRHMWGGSFNIHYPNLFFAPWSCLNPCLDEGVAPPLLVVPSAPPFTLLLLNTHNTPTDFLPRIRPPTNTKNKARDGSHHYISCLHGYDSSPASRSPHHGRQPVLCVWWRCWLPVCCWPPRRRQGPLAHIIFLQEQQVDVGLGYLYHGLLQCTQHLLYHYVHQISLVQRLARWKLLIHFVGASMALMSGSTSLILYKSLYIDKYAEGLAMVMASAEVMIG